jgi:hypothetical protein
MSRPRLITRRGILSVAFVLGVASHPAKGWCISPDEPFFPDRVFDEDKRWNDFVDRWFSNHLKAMKEPSLWMLSQRDTKAVIYRFLWLPTFDRPVSVRIVESKDGATFHAVLLGGRGGYDPGKVVETKSEKLSESQWKDVQARLEKLQFWKMPTDDPEPGGTDGDELILEGTSGGHYHIVVRYGPTSQADYVGLGQSLLALSGLDVMKTWKEYRE